MTDFHQRFREKFPFVSESKPEAAAAFLAFIDEVVAEERAESLRAIKALGHQILDVVREPKDTNSAVGISPAEEANYLREKPIGSDGISEDTCRETPEAIGTPREPEKALPRKGNGYDCGEEGCCRPVEDASQGCCDMCYYTTNFSDPSPMEPACSDKDCPCHKKEL